MTVSHRAADKQASPAAEVVPSKKVARLACCCKLSELLPLVRELHREAARESKAA